MTPSRIDEQEYEPPVIGVDEVGRGPWAGPVVAAAVHINQEAVRLHRAEDPRWLWVRDSKKVSPPRREILFEILTTSPSVQWSIGMASVQEIDTLNIRQATLHAMRRAYQGLKLEGGTLLIDGRDGLAHTSAHHVIPLIQGDDRSFSIAAASIIAKVYRDRWMDRLHQEAPLYGWNQNRGYGTQAHHQAIQRYGITSHHRLSFSPIAVWVRENSL